MKVFLDESVFGRKCFWMKVFWMKVFLDESVFGIWMKMYLTTPPLKPKGGFGLNPPETKGRLVQTPF